MPDITVNWVPLAEVPGLRDARGRLGMTFLPGRRLAAAPAAHQRDLKADASWLAVHDGVDTVVLLVEDDELVRAGVAETAAVMSRQGIALLRHPISDGGVPTDADAFAGLLTDVEGRLAAGETVIVACMGGLGRTGTLVATLLGRNGLEPGAAIALTRRTRPGAIESAAQEDFVRELSKPRRGCRG